MGGTNGDAVPMTPLSPLALPPSLRDEKKSSGRGGVKLRRTQSRPRPSPAEARLASREMGIVSALRSPGTHAALSAEMVAAFEDKHNLLARWRMRRLTATLDESQGEPGSAGEARRGSAHAYERDHYCRPSLGRDTQIDLDYYQPESRHYAWCGYLFCCRLCSTAGAPLRRHTGAGPGLPQRYSFYRRLRFHSFAVYGGSLRRCATMED